MEMENNDNLAQTFKFYLMKLKLQPICSLTVAFF